MKSQLLLVAFCIISLCVPAQNEIHIDSLRNQLKTVAADSTKAAVLYQLSREYWDGNLDSSLAIANQLLTFSEAIDYLKGRGNAYSSMGVAYWYKGDYPNALKFTMLALEAREASGDKKDIAGSFNNMGLIYDDQGNFPLALEYYLRSLQMYEQINDKDGIAQAYNNTGIIYYNQKNYSSALSNLENALKIRLETNDQWGLTESYSNIGLVHFEMKNFDEALRNFESALKLRKEIDDREGLAISYANFGDYYSELNNYDEAMRNYNLALEINRQLGYRKKEANLYLSMSDVYEQHGNTDKAMMMQLEALDLLNEIGADDILAVAYKKLSESYQRKGDFKKAYQYHVLYKEVNDSLFSSDRVRSLTRLQMQYDFDKREAVAKAEQAKKDALTQAEIRRQRIIGYSVTGGLAGVILFSIVVYRQRNKIAKEKKRSDELLLNILPKETAEELKDTGTAKARDFEEVTVMFTDFKNFSVISEQMSAQDLVNKINYCYSAFDNIISKHGLEKIKTIGDSYMCAGGLPVKTKTHAEDTVKAAIAIRDFMLSEKGKHEAEGKPFFEIRIGCHTGPVVAGIVGLKKFAYDIWGDTVNIASRMESSGEPGKINISGSMYELVKDRFRCSYRGKIAAKNKGEIDMYFAEG